MNSPALSVREIEEKDIEGLMSYWFDADEIFLKGMGVDTQKMPTREEWRKMLLEQISQDYKQKSAYCIIWQVDGEAIGHSNVNKIVFGKEAYMHLHIWKNDIRQKGIGSQLVKLTLPYFFNNFQLKQLFCEPYALNPAPNKTLQKVGFEFEKQYVTVPGWINFEQHVNRWKLSLSRWKELPIAY
jgi:RimJ/RimL family protein N-acetyltransferase